MALDTLFQTLKRLGRADLKSAATKTALKDLIEASLTSLASAQVKTLTATVPNKTYAMFASGNLTTRPYNTALFAPQLSNLLAFLDGNTAQIANLDQALYTAGMSYPLARDLERTGDKKSPGTFFEIFVGHIFATTYSVNPKTSITTPTLNQAITVPTDFIFDLGSNRRLHVPVKLSTRERVIQVWAHQRLLDGMHGVGRFKGVLVCANETNKQAETSVVEVCLPGQWSAYQMYISQLERVYYLDPPAAYLALRSTYPHLQVWPLSQFFSEAQTLASPASPASGQAPVP